MISLFKNKSIQLFGLLFLSHVMFNNISAEENSGLTNKGNFLLSGTVNVSNYSYSAIDWWGDTTKIHILTIEGTSSFHGFISKGLGFGGDFHIRHMDEDEWDLSITQIGIGPKVSYFFDMAKIYPFISFASHYLNYTSGPIVGDGFRLKFVGGICAPFSGKAAVLFEAGYLYDKIFYSSNSQSQGTIYLGLGIGGFITHNKR